MTTEKNEKLKKAVEAAKAVSTSKKPATPPKASATTALTRARDALSKVLKEDFVVPLSTDTLRQSMPHIPTGSVIVDYLIGGRPNSYGVAPCPGIPRGRITQLYGNAGAGKTTLALTVAAGVCARGGTVVYIDWENEVEPRYAAALGVPIEDASRFVLLQPETLEQGMKAMIIMASEGVDLIVVDSVGAGTPSDFYNREVDKEGDFGRMGLVAQKWSVFLPKFKSILSRSNTALIGISQLRKTMNGMGMGPDSAPQGGEAWKFYSSVRIMLRVFSKENGKVLNGVTGKVEEMPTGAVVKVKLEKCKVSDSVHQEQKFYLRSGTGIDNTRSVVDLALAYGVLTKSGSYYGWGTAPGGEIRVQGVDALLKTLSSDPRLVPALFAAVMPKLNALAAAPPSDLGEEEASGEGLDPAELDDLFKTVGGSDAIPDAAPEED